jgi:hypothetical protein
MLLRNKYIGTIINNRRWMRLIRKQDKTCEIKSKMANIPKLCKHLVFHGNRKLRASGCKYNLMATLLSHTPLGPFRTAKAVTIASKIAGKEFKTGMSESRLDRFIQKGASKMVYIYRFEDAHVTNRVIWSDSKGNNHPGFLPMMNKERGCMRFCVTEPEQEGRTVLPSRWGKTNKTNKTNKRASPRPASYPTIPRIQAKVDARLRIEASRFIGPHPLICDLTLD